MISLPLAPGGPHYVMMAHLSPLKDQGAPLRHGQILFIFSPGNVNTGPDKQKMQNTALFKARWWKEREKREERREINKEGWFWTYFQNVLNQGHPKDVWA